MLQIVPLWAWALSISLALRLPLSLVSGPGRDEAAYYYWARHSEFGYAPLLLILLRIFDGLGLPTLAAIRLPSVLGASLSLVLLDRYLENARVDRRGRKLALLTLALSPWQLLVGALLHPDALFLAALLGLALAMQSKRAIAVAGCVAAALLSKPTGLVLLPLFVFWFWRHCAPRQRYLYFALMVILSAVALGLLSSKGLREIFEFGRLSPSLSIGMRVWIAVFGLLFHGVLLLPIAALQSIVDACRDLMTGTSRTETWVHGMAIVLLVFFAGAALVHSQFKGNWILPACVLLWPLRPLRIKSFFLAACLGLSLGLSISTLVVIRNPELLRRVEAHARWRNWYERVAGTREARVSSTRMFSERFLEFQGSARLADEILELWQAETGSTKLPRWIVSDDYGLAAQLAYHWRRGAPELWIPNDGLFQGRSEGPTHYQAQDLLLLASQRPLLQIWPAGKFVRQCGELEYPVTRRQLVLGTASSTPLGG